MKLPRLAPVPPGERRGWTLTVDGARVDCAAAELTSPIGTWQYGWHPRGYDTWWFTEERGGGSLTLPYARRDGELLVGLLSEDRPNMGGAVLCAIGGYVDPGEDHATAQAREAEEETGLTGTAMALGEAVNPNRAFFVMDAAQGAGVHLFAVQIDASALEARGDGWMWRARRGAEVREVSFLPWRAAVDRTSDGMALAAIARLVAQLPTAR